MLTKGRDTINRYKVKKTLRDPLNLGELVHVLTERLRKKDAAGKLYKSSTGNKSFS